MKTMSKLEYWWYSIKDDLIGYTVLVFLCSFFIWLFSLFGYSVNVQAKCAKNGYPHSITTWNYKAYCIRTIEQTEYIITLSELLGG